MTGGDPDSIHDGDHDDVLVPLVTAGIAGDNDIEIRLFEDLRHAADVGHRDMADVLAAAVGLLVGAIMTIADLRRKDPEEVWQQYAAQLAQQRTTE